MNSVKTLITSMLKTGRPKSTRRDTACRRWSCS